LPTDKLPLAKCPVRGPSHKLPPAYSPPQVPTPGGIISIMHTDHCHMRLIFITHTMPPCGAAGTKRRVLSTSAPVCVSTIECFKASAYNYDLSASGAAAAAAAHRVRVSRLTLHAPIGDARVRNILHALSQFNAGRHTTSCRRQRRGEHRCIWGTLGRCHLAAGFDEGLRRLGTTAASRVRGGSLAASRAGHQRAHWMWHGGIGEEHTGGRTRRTGGARGGTAAAQEW
jgi:hypothetical protein